ncbi:MAG: hypothetical protein ACPGYT_01480 [Nitrospirales bacterium]
MPTAHHDQLPLWSIILTGKEKSQARPLFEPRLGYNKPAPFCTFVGSRSMLQHTWDRADQLSHPNSKITVAEKTYLHEICTQLGGRVPGIIMTEPRHRGMVASLFLALTYLQVKEPQALIAAYPSDHFVYPEDSFLKTVQRAIWSTERFRDHIFMIGAAESLDPPAGGYITIDQQLGWIYGIPVYGVQDLVRTSPPSMAKNPYSPTLYLSNTSVLIARAEVLWNMGWQFIPEMMELFAQLQDAIGTSYERAVLESIFKNSKLWDTSILTLLQLTPKLAVIELEKVIWSDWGTPQHIAENLAKIGKEPAFPIEYTKSAGSWV